MEGNSPDIKIGNNGDGSIHLQSAFPDIELTETQATKLLADLEAALKASKEHKGPKQLTLPFTEWEWIS